MTACTGGVWAFSMRRCEQACVQFLLALFPSEEAAARAERDKVFWDAAIAAAAADLGCSYCSALWKYSTMENLLWSPTTLIPPCFCFQFRRSRFRVRMSMSVYENIRTIPISHFFLQKLWYLLCMCSRDRTRCGSLSFNWVVLSWKMALFFCFFLMLLFPRWPFSEVKYRAWWALKGDVSWAASPCGGVGACGCVWGGCSLWAQMQLREARCLRWSSSRISLKLSEQELGVIISTGGRHKPRILSQ